MISKGKAGFYIHSVIKTRQSEIILLDVLRNVQRIFPWDLIGLGIDLKRDRMKK